MDVKHFFSNLFIVSLYIAMSILTVFLLSCIDFGKKKFGEGKGNSSGSTESHQN